MITRYAITKYGRQIKAVQFVKETDKMLIDGRGRRYHKHTAYEDFYDSWQEAHDVLLQRTQHRLEAARDEVKSYTAYLEEIKAMTPPSGEPSKERENE